MSGLERLLLALGLALVVVVGVWALVAPEGPQRPAIVSYAVERGYMPCEREDSVGPCYWDATRDGNGRGKSFVVTDDNEVFYE